MKFIGVFVALFLLGFCGAAKSAVRAEYSGAWYNPLQSGHGLSIEVISTERSIAFWYVYNSSGHPLFLYADGINVGNQIQAKVYYFEGMTWGVFDPATNIRSDWGTITITFHDCRNATLEYDSNVPISGEVFGSGQIPIYHLASIDDFKCFDFPLAGIYFGKADTGESIFGDPEANGYAVVTETGSFNFYSGGIMLSAQMEITEGHISHFSMSGKAHLRSADGITFSGQFFGQGNHDSDRIALRFDTTEPHAAGDVLLTKMSRKSSRSISLSELAGQWIVVNPMTGWVGIESINSDGTFVFTDQLGCTFNGKIDIPNIEVSLLEATVEISECDSNSGLFAGSGAFIEDEYIYSSSDLMILMLWNEEGIGTMLSFVSLQPNSSTTGKFKSAE